MYDNGPPDNLEGEPPQRSNAAVWTLVGIIAALVVGVIVMASMLVAGGETGETSPPEALPTTTLSTEEPADTTTTVPGDTTTTTAADATTTTAAETTTTTTAETTTTIVEPSPAEAAALSAAADWIDAIGAGDEEAAWELVADASREGVGGRDGFGDLFVPLQEGFGAWADAEVVVWYPNTLDDETVVVTLVGTITQEGNTGPAAAAIPVRVDDELEAKVEPFIRGDLVEWVVPDPSDGSPVLDDPNPTFQAIVPAETVTMFVSGEIADDLLVVDAGDGTYRVTGTSPFPLEVGGQYVVTVVYTNEGIIHADALPFAILEDSQ